MNTVIKQIKRCFTIYTALFITLITSRFARAATINRCELQQLTECAKPLSFISESGMTFLSSRNDIEKICPDLKVALKCIHSYTRTCMTMHHRRHFNKLFHGTGSMVHDLCNNATYQEEYLKYVPCMSEVADQNQVCFDRYSQAMNEMQRKPSFDEEATIRSIDLVEYQKKKKRQIADEGIKNVCCTFQEYVECSTINTQKACGVAAADFSRNFLDRMSSAMIKMHCSEYGTKQCGLEASSASTSNNYFTLTTTLVVAILTSLRYVLIS